MYPTKPRSSTFTLLQDIGLQGAFGSLPTNILGGFHFFPGRGILFQASIIEFEPCLAGLNDMRIERVKYGSMALLLMATGGFRLVGQRSQPHCLLHDYYPAFCRAAAYPSANFRLVIFPPARQQVSIEVPLRLELFAFAPNGTALYSLESAAKNAVSPCAQRVELSPVRITRLACLAGLGVAFSFAVSASEDRLLVSGRIMGATGARCGVFETRLPEAVTRQVLAEACPSYDFGNSWGSLSLSPGADEAVAVRRGDLELIDVSGATTRVIAHGILEASWSPDGRWIAAHRARGGTELIDSRDPSKRRRLAESEARWSPDSRYLLRVKGCRFPAAVNGVGTVLAVDVETNKQVTIESSRCTVDSGATGWVSRSAIGAEAPLSPP
jgi:hypothetical protein